MIKTTIIFEYGNEEFAVTIYDQHVDPHALLIQHRGVLGTSSKEFTNLSTHRQEIRHAGQPDDIDDELDELEQDLDDLASVGANPDRLTKAEIYEWVYGDGGGWTE